VNIQKFKTDPILELEGTWIELGDGGSVKVARWGNDRAKKIYEAQTGVLEIKNAIRFGTLTDEKATEIETEVMAGAILVDWKGLDENGTPIPFTPENAKRILKLKDFRNLILRASQSQELYREASEVAAVENLKKT
jgi:hypothetical protein